MSTAILCLCFSVTINTMTIKSDTTYCADAEWVGRAHCGKCHIRRLMLFSELPENAFDNLLQPIDHFIYAPGVDIQYQINNLVRGNISIGYYLPGKIDMVDVTPDHYQGMYVLFSIHLGKLSPMKQLTDDL